jgi:exodeoxyribonuclease V alpha subunit
VVDKDAATDLLARLAEWNVADARGEVEKLITSAGVVVDGAVRRELAEDLAARVVDGSRPLLGRDEVPEHVRALTSPLVLSVERQLVARIARRADAATITVIEGAAGSGKTRRLASMRAGVEARGGRMLAVTPTRKAAQVASHEVGTAAQSVAWLLHQEHASDLPHGRRAEHPHRRRPNPRARRLDRDQ